MCLLIIVVVGFFFNIGWILCVVVCFLVIVSSDIGVIGVVEVFVFIFMN